MGVNRWRENGEGGRRNDRGMQTKELGLDLPGSLCKHGLEKLVDRRELPLLTGQK